MVIKALKFGGGLWLAVTFARIVARLEVTGAVIGYWDAFVSIAKGGLILQMVIAASLIGVGMFLESRGQQ